MMSKVSPRQRRHDLTRQKILDSARQIIVEQGLQSLSMRTLAERIDYSPSAIYKYFEDKEDILVAIREEGWQLSAAMAQGVSMEGLTPPEKLLAGGKSYLAFAARYPEHYLLMFHSPDLPDGNVKDLQTDPRFTGLIGLLQEGIATGYFRLPEGYTPFAMAFQLWVTIHGIAMLRRTMMKADLAEFDAMVDGNMSAFIKSFTIK
jgi:AcrR family transcriptional regulator